MGPLEESRICCRCCWNVGPFVSAVELDVGRMGRSAICCRCSFANGTLGAVQVVAAVASDMGPGDITEVRFVVAWVL